MKTYAIMNMTTGDLVTEPANPYKPWVSINYGVMWKALLAYRASDSVVDPMEFCLVEV